MTEIHLAYLGGPGYKKVVKLGRQVAAELTSSDHGLTWTGKRSIGRYKGAAIVESARYPGGPNTRGQVTIRGNPLKRWAIDLDREQGCCWTRIEYPGEGRVIQIRSAYFGAPPQEIDEHVRGRHVAHLTTRDYLRYTGTNPATGRPLTLLRRYPGERFWRSESTGSGPLGSYLVQDILLSVFDWEMEESGGKR